jgi:hypothetical protein
VLVRRSFLMFLQGSHLCLHALLSIFEKDIHEVQEVRKKKQQMNSTMA